MARTGDVLHSCRPPISTLTQASGAGFLGHSSDAGRLTALVMQICASRAQVTGAEAASKNNAAAVHIMPTEMLFAYKRWV